MVGSFFEQYLLLNMISLWVNNADRWPKPCIFQNKKIWLFFLVLTVRRYFYKKHFSELQKLHAPSLPCTCHILKSCSTYTEKRAHKWICFEVSLISKIFEKYFTELLCFCFDETSFVIHFLFCGDRRCMYVQFSTVIWKFPLIPH